ncbi:MAG: GntR family transcriptional regulator, partial [Planctomycetes bacterium]|nr:GntR family transcriptional regulator [Planctomycetota bacterium]
MASTLMAKLTSHRALALQIATILRKELLTKYQPGDRIPGDNELAERFAVSYMTVRQAMVSLVHEGVLVRRQGKGTYVAELVGSQTVAIYCELDLYRHPPGTYAALIVGQLQQVLEEARIPSQVFLGTVPAYTKPNKQAVPAEPTCASFLEAVQNQRLRGVFAINSHPHEAWLKPLRQRKVPVIGADVGLEHQIRNDTTSGIGLAIAHLAKSGIRDIALLDWLSAGGVEGPESTRHAFRQAMLANGLELRPQRIAGDIHPLIPGAGWFLFKSVWEASDRKPQALIIGDDHLFRDALDAALAQG